MKPIDVGDELVDLLKIYKDAQEVLEAKEETALKELNYYMKKYLDAKAEHDKLLGKVVALKEKVEKNLEECSDCDTDYEDEEEE